MRSALIRASVLGALVVLLAGCGAAQNPAMPSSASAQVQGHHGSWMLPEAKGDDLLYLSGEASSTVYVFAYPSGKAVGELTGILFPTFECGDKSGNVFVTSSDDSTGGVYEFAHGGTKPLEFLPLDQARGCSVDPVTGNLAVVNFGDTVYMYAKATGSPTKYTDYNLYNANDVAYDNMGNLFVDGEYESNRYFALLELPYSAQTFEDITLAPVGDYNGDDYDPILWDGKYLDLGSHTHHVLRGRILRLQISGSNATVAHKVTLGTQKRGSPQFWLRGSEIVQPSNKPQSSFQIFDFPSGRPVKRVKLRQQDNLWGAVISPSGSQK